MRAAPLICIQTGLAIAMAITCLAPISTHGEDFPLSRDGKCRFDAEAMKFEGTAVEQATCLLRPIGMGASIGTSPAVLPRFLDVRIGQAVDLSPAQLGRYLEEQKIGEDQVGGSLHDPLSSTGRSEALYFVIHDTSTPNYGVDAFPPDIDTSEWRYNRLGYWESQDEPVAHVFVGRVGNSVTAVEFGRGWRATKFENKTLGLASRGRFLHIELVQPRRSNPAGRRGNDLIAPSPGFPQAQLRRLATIYAAASVRKGSWMIPAFHAVIDTGFSGAHDDPQNFDLNAFATELSTLLDEISDSALR